MNKIVDGYNQVKNKSMLNHKDKHRLFIYIEQNKNNGKKNILYDNETNILNEKGKRLINAYGTPRIHEILNEYGQHVINEYNNNIVNKNGNIILNEYGTKLINDHARVIINNKGTKVLSDYAINFLKSKKKNEFEVIFKNVSQLIYCTIRDIILIGVVFFILIGTIGSFKSNDYYPIDLKSDYYINKDNNCDLDNIKAHKDTLKDYCQPLENVTSNIPTKSWFSTHLISSAQTGPITSGGWGGILFFLFYLLFNLEYFFMKCLNYIHTNGKIAVSAEKKSYLFLGILYFIFGLFIYIFSVANHLITSLLIRMIKKLSFNKLVIHPDVADFSHLPINIITYVFFIFIILFIMFLIPSCIYFMFLLFKIVTSNMSTQITILALFFLIMTTNTLIRMTNSIKL